MTGANVWVNQTKDPSMKPRFLLRRNLSQELFSFAITISLSNVILWKMSFFSLLKEKWKNEKFSGLISL
jgi:hypothetical protein